MLRLLRQGHRKEPSATARRGVELVHELHPSDIPTFTIVSVTARRGDYLVRLGAETS